MVNRNICNRTESVPACFPTRFFFRLPIFKIENGLDRAQSFCLLLAPFIKEMRIDRATYAETLACVSVWKFFWQLTEIKLWPGIFRFERACCTIVRPATEIYRET